MIGEIRVDCAALRENAKTMRALAAPAKCAFVLKSNAYGHGLAETGLAVEPFADAFCVYALEEAVALRDAGVTIPLLILGPVEAKDLALAHAAKAAITLWNKGAYARDAAVVARTRGQRFPVHVKIDTGVARLGLSIRDAPDVIEEYARLADLSVEGVFSHFASVEEADSEFTLEQLAKFERVLAQSLPMLAASNVHPLRHLAASAATMCFPQTRLDLVRVGIALYGLWPSAGTRQAMPETSLVPALSLTSSLVSTRDIAAGTPVGYGTSFHAQRATRVGVVPLGYADGIPRALSNTGAFFVRGKRCAILGRVCMNMTMIDVTGVDGATPGSTVTLIGREDVASVTVDDWADWARTITYEIVSRLPETLPRRHALRD